MAACLRCGASVADSSRFCGDCGAPVSAALRPRQEVRKTVTILFCDVVDSTVLGEQNDPETVRQAMSRYFKEMQAIVEGHGGVVERFRGDEVMAVFGVPAVHEDDALRAVRTGMAMLRRLEQLNTELQTTWNVSLACRIGINTGEVVAGDPGTGASFVTGDAVNLAKRLEQAAGTGEILIGTATYPLVRDAVKVGPRESFSVKGKQESVSPFRLHDVDTMAAGVARRLDAPIVNREVELALLQEAAEGCSRGSHCRLLTVMGPAGIGKSRLVAERLAQLEGRFRPLRGRCLPYGEAITFWPVRDIVLEAGGEQGLTTLLAGVEDGTRIAELIRTAVGQATGAAAAEETFWAIRRFLEELARERPLLVCFDDVHWASPTLLDLIEYLAGWLRAPVLLLVLARSDLLEARPSWSTPRANAAVLPLEALSDAESDRLLAQLAEGVKLPSASRERILAAADGNPFFVEQMVAMAAEAGGDPAELRTPPTIQALLAERLDRLSTPERNLLERASVIGKELPYRALIELTVPEERDAAVGHLFSLVRKDFVQPIRPQRHGDMLAFRHDLIRVAAYEAVPKEVRARLHEQFANWLEDVAGAQIGELEEIVGYHLEQAYRCRAAIGTIDTHTATLATRSAQRLESTGRRALARSDLPAAISLLERAADLLALDAPRRAALLPELGAALIEAGRLDDAEPVLEEARQLAASAEDDRADSHAVIQQQFLQLLRVADSSTEEAARAVDTVIPVFERCGDEHGLCRARKLEALMQWNMARAAAAADAWDKAAEHARRAGDEDERNEILSWVASSMFFGPTPVPEGVRRCEAIRAEVVDNPGSEAWALRSLAGLHAMVGRFELARKLLAEANEIFEELGQTRSSSASDIDGIVELLAGDLGAAEERLRTGYLALENMGDRAFRPTTAAHLAEALYAQGRDEDAGPLTEISEQLAARDDLLTQVVWRRVRAKVMARQGRLDEAEGLAREAVTISEATDFLNTRADALVDLAHIHWRAGRLDEARTGIAKGVALYEAKGNRVAADRTRAHLEVLQQT